MGKFVIYKVPTGYNFHLKAVNGETIGTSQVYVSKATCLTGIESVQHNVRVAHMEDQTLPDFQTEKCPKFEIYTDKAGEFRFRLIATNGQEVLASQGYSKKPSCHNGILSVIENAPDAAIEEDEKE